MNWAPLEAVLSLIGAVIVAINLLTKISDSRKAWSGWLLTRDNGGAYSNGARIVEPYDQTKIHLSWLMWLACILPWPGKKKWADLVYTKVALLGAEMRYEAVSKWDWDEAWVIIIDDDNMIASSNRLGTALSYLKHMGV